MRCLLIGNFGIGNLGDEALKDYFLQTFPSVEWIVVSATPSQSDVPRLPGGIRSLFRTSWGKTIAALRTADVVVFGGGTLLTDAESLYACFLWSMHAAVARFFHKPLMLAFQGVGPFQSRMGEGMARWVVRQAAFISVRDEASLRRIKRWFPNKNVVQTYDPVYSNIKVQNKEGVHKVFIIIPRKNSPDAFVIRARELLASDRWEDIEVLSLHPDDNEEQKTLRHLLVSLDLPPSVLKNVRTLVALEHHVQRASFVLTQRFHGAVAAVAAGVPMEVMGQKEGDKLWEIARLAQDPDGRGRMLAGVETGRQALKDALEASAERHSR